MSDDVIPPSPQHRDEEVLRHVLAQVRTGRSLDDVLQDPYVEERREDRKSTRLNSSHVSESRMPSSA